MEEIKIAIDKESCRGCSLCSDICPTHVFEFDALENIPKVVKSSECFGCLSCSEICPAGAIEHEFVQESEHYYRDGYTQNIALKLGNAKAIIDHHENTALHQAALDDLGIRLLSVASVLRQTLGESLPAIGTMAGRSLAAQLPRYQQPADTQEALSMAVDAFAPACGLIPTLSGDALRIEVRGCYIRKLCKKEGLALGGDLCALFNNYLTGFLGKSAGIRPRLMKCEPGTESCLYELKIYH